MILGIDPGPKESAYVMFDGVRIVAHRTVLNEALLTLLNADNWTVCGGSVAVAIEWIVGYGLTVGNETFHTCRWVGRFEEAAGCVEGDGHLITRKEIKSHLCSNTQAKDQHVRQALIDRIGPVGTRKNPGPTFGIVGHEWSALSVAVTWCDRHKEAV